MQKCEESGVGCQIECTREYDSICALIGERE